MLPEETYVLIQSNLSKRSQWIILVRPDLSHIKDIEAIRLSILRLHDLHIYCPARIFHSLNCLKQILLVVIGVFACHFGCACGSVVLYTLVGFEVDFHVVKGTVLGLVSL